MVPATAPIPEEDLCTSGKIPFLAKNFARVGAIVVFLHETRTEGPQMRPSHEYLAVTSGSSKARSHGEEIWLACDIPMRVLGKDHYIHEGCVQVLHAEETILLIELTVGPLRLHLLAGHAPPSGEGARIRAWWRALRGILSRYARPGVETVFGIDANGRIGEASHPHAGGHQPAMIDAAGKELLATCQLLRTALPQIFEGAHRGPTET